MKGIIKVLLSSLLLAFILSSCGDSKSEGRKSKVTSISSDHTDLSSKNRSNNESDTLITLLDTFQNTASTVLTQAKTSQPENEEVKKETIKKAPLKKKKLKKSKAQIEFDSQVYHFDTIVSGDIISYKFKFKNTGTAPLKVLKTEVSCGCTVPSYPFLDIRPGDNGFIGVTYNSVGKKENQKAEVKVYTNTKNSPISLYVEGFVKEPKE